MRSPIPFALAAVLAFSAHAQDAKQDAKKPFSDKSFGDGGGYKHPDESVGGFFENAGKPANASPDKPSAPPAGPDRENAGPAQAEPARPERPERPRPRPFESVQAEPAKKGVIPATASLWNGKLKPLPGAPAAGDDAASEDARRDYESRLLGASADGGAARPSLSGGPSAPGTLAASDPAAADGALFVSLELDAKEAASLRDAVAGLGAAASFRPDARFEPAPAPDGGVRLSGWLPASRLGDAISRPGVRRVSVERGARPSPAAKTTGDFLVGLRVSDPAKPEESAAAGIRDLSERAGFKLTRVLGVETAPDGASVAVVAGTLPLDRLSAAMGRPSVLKIEAAVLEFQSAPAPAPKPKLGGFLRFAATRGAWLLLLTVLLAIPTIGGAVRDGLAVFVPYR